MTALVLLPLILACSSTKLLRLENQLLQASNAELRVSLAECDQHEAQVDYATEVNNQLIQGYLERAGFPEPIQRQQSVWVVAIDGENTSFGLTVQFFEEEKVLFLGTNNYLEIEEADSSQSMVLLLTQLAALNHEMLLGKYQLNPRNGDISLSVELNVNEGLGFRTFAAMLQHLVSTADARYPELLRAAQPQGI